MTIFDSGLFELPYVQEKTLRALEDAARFVDLANEPDTTKWYAKRLRELASPAVTHLVAAVAHVYQAGADAVRAEHVDAILKGGTFALARWSKEFKIVDSVRVAFAPFAPARTDEEIDEKAEAVPEALISAEEAHALDLRLEVCGAMARAMLHQDLPDVCKRILCWLVMDLTRSSFADVVVVSRKFLPGDIDRTAEETAAAYRALYERGLIERVDGVPNLRDDAIALRLVAAGLNGSKHPAPFREETFGYPGARIAGKRTTGNELWVYPNQALAKASERWLATDAELLSLREAMQRALGEDRAYVETVQRGSTERGSVLRVRVRFPYEADEAVLQAELEAVADAWLRALVVRTR
ncbi:MAG: hypothetical protein HYV09_10850 [Deltaproteobacteria bacterium]|nr:hypothetical protein [Deltaproteobacteria bacterium]